ncbi:DUF433 domain-containing protein [Spirosoma montaniterrae]|uniref:Antitoxin n=1 Tax=Spirosoma montaniterrae TaxID=1178516 RepID=A0A1P9WUF4_9BACT|nr:DUF433 domain-containing protein [Spirosoma montaniterrae]AQG78970.1 antitoxin [Spirosoma montaniterrae]
MTQQASIIRNPAVMMGKPTIAGTRITVELIVRKLAGGFTIDDILGMYPHLSREQVLAALDYAANLIAHEIVIE